MGILLGIFSLITLVIAFVLLLGEKNRTRRIVIVMTGFFVLNLVAYVMAAPVLH